MPDDKTQDQGKQSETPATTWEDALKGLPEAVQNLYNQHVTGLQNAVKATRTERDDLAKQIRDLSVKAEKGSELEKSLTDITGRLEAAERRAQFAEDAVKPEIGCRNIKAAYALAVADNLFTRAGAPDWTAIKAAAPELFGAATGKAHAGDGTDKQPAAAGMNELILRAAGRR